MNQLTNSTFKRTQQTKFDVSDNMLLRKLIDKYPGVKNVSENTDALRDLWKELAVEYNRHALQYRDVVTLRRKYKSMRDTIKKRMKEAARPDGSNKRPRLGSDQNYRPSLDSRGGPSPGSGLMSAGIGYFSNSVSSNMNRSTDGLGIGMNMGMSSYAGGPSPKRIAYETPGRLAFSPTRMSNSFSDPYQLSNNNPPHQFDLKIDQPILQEYYDPFSVNDKESYHEEEDNYSDQKQNSDHGGQADLDVEIAQLQREKLNREIVYARREHEKLLTRMSKYHDMKMTEMSQAIQQQRAKHTIEIRYLKLKVQQCQLQIKKEGGNPFEDTSTRPNDYFICKEMQKKARKNTVVDLTAKVGGGNEHTEGHEINEDEGCLQSNDKGLQSENTGDVKEDIDVGEKM